MNKLYSLIVAAVMAAVAGSCGPSAQERQRLSRAERRALARQDSAALKIATTPTMDCLPLFVGVDDSLFRAAGVDVRLRARSSQMDGDTLIAGGHVEGVATDLVRAERLRREGTPLRYVAATNAQWQLVANRLARVQELKQLSDKMIAMTRHSATDWLADMAVDSAKPKHDVYRIQVNDVHVRLRMLLNNEMDAMLLPEPQATVVRLHRNPVLMDSRDKGLRLGVIAFSERALKDKRRRRQLQLFVKAYNQACDSINRNGTAHYAAVIRKYMDVDGKTIAALPRLHYAHAAAPRPGDVERARRRNGTGS